MLPDSPGNFCVVIRYSCKSFERSNARLAMASQCAPRRTPSQRAGGYDFRSGLAKNVDAIPWTAQALPTVIAIAALPENPADSRFRLDAQLLKQLLAPGKMEQQIQRNGTTFRIYRSSAGAGPPAVLLPFDRLFEVRVNAAIRLWRGLNNRNPGPNPAMFSKHRGNRLILALRALDARLESATYREIADALFDLGAMSARSWKTHDLRDQAIRLARLGSNLMQGGYRDLLLHPYRRRP